MLQIRDVAADLRGGQWARSLFEGRSVLDRVRRQDHRIGNLSRIAASGEVRVVPDLLHLVADDESLAPYVARTIAHLLREVTPVQLTWLDEHARPSFSTHHRPRAWARFSPDAVAAQPTAKQLQRIRALLASEAPQMPEET